MFIEAPELELASRRRATPSSPAQGGVSEGIYASLNGGLGSSDDPARVRENRRRMAAQLGVRGRGARQRASGALAGRDRRRGALAGASARAPTAWRRGARAWRSAITTADCGPVLFADPEAGVIGACHAGWRGALAGVLEATRRGDGRPRRAARAHRSRCSGRRSARTPTRSARNSWREFLAPDAGERALLPATAPRAGHAMFDLPGYIGARLAAAGVGEFADLGLCTYSDEDALLQLPPRHPPRRDRITAG